MERRGARDIDVEKAGFEFRIRENRFCVVLVVLARAADLGFA